MVTKENIDSLNGTSKWLYKLQNEEGVWQELLRNKYLHSKSLSEVKMKASDSPFWKGLMKVKEDFLSRGLFLLVMERIRDFGKTLG
jgi:hypothetical protein